MNEENNMVVGKIEQLTTEPPTIGLSDIERLVMCDTKSTDIWRLLKAAKKWDTEDSRYLCLGWNNAVYFSNNIDCDGTRYWSRKGFAKFIAKQRS
jgi:hypothetical protein